MNNSSSSNPNYSFLSSPYRPLPLVPSTSTTSTSNNDETIPPSYNSILNLESLNSSSNASTSTSENGNLTDESNSSSGSSTMPLLEEIPSTSTTNSANKRKKKRTIEDLEKDKKTCWICLDDFKNDSNFVHACDCTLISHEECLLEYISSREDSPKCPACNSNYIIKQNNSTILKIYKKIIKIYDKISLGIALGTIGSGIWLTSSTYTLLVLKFWLGENSIKSLLFNQQNQTTRWPISFYLKLPTLPFLLILSRTNILDSLLPFITLILATTGNSNNTGRVGLTYPISLSIIWPPSAGLTICILPWIRLGYLSLRKRVWNSLGRKPQLSLINMLDIEEEERGDNLVAAVEVIEEGPQIINGAGGGGERIIRQRISIGRFNSLLVSTLLSPFLAALTGAGLLYLANRNENKSALILRKVLGLSSSSSSTSSTTLLAPSTSFTIQKSISSFAASTLTSIGLSSLLSPFSSSPSTLSNPSSPSLNSTDPIWIRNSIGLGLIILIRDVVELIVGGLEDSRKKSRRVVGREFGEGLEL